MSLPLTPSQTIGPFSHEAWRWACAASEAAGNSGLSTIALSGIIRDGDGTPIDDAMIETWSPAAAAAEEQAGLPLAGFRRVASDAQGRFALRLPRPAADSAGQPAAYVTVFARGLVLHQFSVVFLEDGAGLDDAAILRQVPAERRATLIARRSGSDTYEWDIAMQGAGETVFFDYA